MSEQLFDAWPEHYNAWFETPIGALVKEYELKLVMEMLQPQPGETILDVGCGTGIFTRAVIDQGAKVVGLDLSQPMLQHAQHSLPATEFSALTADMLALPFSDGCFNKTLSVTALEFVADGARAFHELFRVTRPGGLVVVATLNSLSPWAIRRESEVHSKENSVFNHTYFRSPDDLRALAGVSGTVDSAVHFTKDEEPTLAREIEAAGQQQALDSGAFVIGCWRKHGGFRG
jgi:ubiquinone/menaquinone biosynthesis C-methylase UbiE